ncbi:ureidoglycolate lyase [Brevibacillus fluminis]|nr:ureidoglycolate lyase [Brevibacillus fluminis]
MKIKAVPVSAIDFSKFGTYFSMKEEAENLLLSKGDGWEDRRTNAPLLRTSGSLGVTLGSPAPCEVRAMERHLHTEEAIFCMADPIVVALAHSAGSKPLLSDIQVVVLTPGDVIVLRHGVWHDACHGINKSAHYYWMATESDEQTEWIDIVGGPLEVAL